jgi:uncharacterized protein (TIGR00369 family)
MRIQNQHMDESRFATFRELIEEQIPFNKFLGVRVETLEPGVCRLKIPFRQELIGDAGRKTLHGGVISMLIATCGGFAVWSMCNSNDKISTIDMRIDYLHPALNRDLVAEARVRLVGNRVGNAHTVVFAEGAREDVLAEGSAVYNIRRAEERCLPNCSK